MAASTSENSSFNWVKTGVPAWAPLLGFFAYTALILFVGFGLIPNFTPLSNTVFRPGMIALIFLIDWILNTGRTWYTLQGTVNVGPKYMELVSQRGRTEHRINYSDVKQYQIHDGVQFSLFRFLSPHRTLVVELALNDGSKLLFECAKWSPKNKGLSISSVLEKHMG